MTVKRRAHGGPSPAKGIDLFKWRKEIRLVWGNGRRSIGIEGTKFDLRSHGPYILVTREDGSYTPIAFIEKKVLSSLQTRKTVDGRPIA